MGSYVSLAIGLAVLSLGVPAPGATVLSFTGDLRNDANIVTCQGVPCVPPLSTDFDYAQFAAFVATFNVASPSSMEAITFSYGGGTNGNGAAIAPNGFEPYLSLFDSSGNFLTSTFLGTTCPAATQTNPDTDNCFDVSLDGGNLSPGNYQIAISAFQNMSLAENSGTGTLADGFTGLGNLAEGEDLHFAFDVILDTPAAPVPEPGTLYLAFSAITLCAIRRRAKGLLK